MKVHILQILALLLMVASISAQENQPKLIDEFSNLGLDEKWNRIGGLTVERGYVLNSKVLVQITGGQKKYFGAPYIEGSLITAILKNTFKIPSENFSMQFCNINSESLSVKLFLVRENDQVKSCEENLSVPKETVHFDNIYFTLPKFKLTPFESKRVGPIDYAQGEYSKIAWDVLKKLLKDSPDSKIYTIAYLKTNFETNDEGKLINNNPRRLDKKSFATAMLRNVKSELIKNGFSPSQMVALDGGYRNEIAQKLEFWFVPKGGEIPKPKPDYFPKKKRQNIKIKARRI